MDVIFECPKCGQELSVDASAAGSAIECPSCSESITIPQPDPTNIRTASPISTSAEAREERHFTVPMHEAPSESLIQKPNAPLDAAVQDEEKKLRIKCFKRVECVEVGKDHFEEVVSSFLAKVGEQNVINISTINYSTLDIGTQKLLTDFGVLIVYKG